MFENLQAYEAQALSVSNFIAKSNQYLDQLGLVLVVGEISALNKRQHMYFSIKDENSSLDCAMFYRSLSSLNFNPSIGHKVLVVGKLSIYSKNGSFKLIVEQMELAGLGRILASLKELELKLEQEGLFSYPKRSLKPLVNNVAIITSCSGAVINDIINNVKRRNHLINLYFFDSIVQGNDAPQSLYKSLTAAYNMCNYWHFDAIIIGRGGGSVEELLCFSDENLVRLIARSPVPIISAVGHDNDCPLSDRAADIRVSTPTAAAELISSISLNDLKLKVINHCNYLDDCINSQHDFLSAKLDKLMHRLNQFMQNIYYYLQKQNHKLSTLDFNGEKLINLKFNQAKDQLNLLKHNLNVHLVDERLFKSQLKLQHLVTQLELVAYKFNRYQERVVKAQHNLQQNLNAKIDNYQHIFHNLFFRLKAKSIEPKIQLCGQNIDNLTFQLNANINVWQQVYYQKYDSLNLSLKEYIKHLKPQLDNYSHALQANTMYKLDYQVKSCLNKKEQSLELIINKLNSPHYEDLIVHKFKQRVNRAYFNLKHIDNHLQQLESRFIKIEQKLDKIGLEIMQNKINSFNERLIKLISQLNSLNPLFYLQRGLSFTTYDAKHALDQDKLKVGDKIITLMSNTTIYSTVDKIEHSNNIKKIAN